MRSLALSVASQIVSFLLCFHIAALGAAQAETGPSELFRHPTLGFEVKVPTDFETIVDPYQNVGLVLKPTLDKYPTFNVLVLPGSYDTTRDIAIQVKQLLDDYGRVGIRDPKASTSSIGSIAGYPTLFVIVDYTLNNTDMRSNVAIVNGSERHFILTFLTPEDQWNASAGAYRIIIESFRLLDPPPVAPVKKDGSSGLYYTLVAIGLVVILTVFFTAKKNKR